MTSKSAVGRSGALWLVLVVGAALCTQARSQTSTPDDEPAKLQSRISDLTSKDSISIVIVGDTGAKAFSMVGRAIASYCGEHTCDLGILLGDNFYLRPFLQGPLRANSRAFEKRFYSPLGDLEAGFDICAVLGNHGYVMWGRPQAIRLKEGSDSTDYNCRQQSTANTAGICVTLPRWGLLVIVFESWLLLHHQCTTKTLPMSGRLHPYSVQRHLLARRSGDGR